MAKEEYLKGFRPDLLSGSVDEMLQTGRLQDRQTLIAYLSGALDYLKTTKGPNQQYRIDHADDWIGWWIDFLKKDSVPGQLISFDKIKSSLVPGVEYGDLFGGGSEAHAGHRFAIDHMLKHVRPILLLERDAYIKAKPRGGPFLDLRARMSMWANYDPRIIVSVLPEMPVGANPSIHYDKLFKQTGADYCFASESDPYLWEKIGRGKFELFTKIPGVYVQHTTDSVEKLIPDTDPEELVNTSRHVKRLRDKGEKNELEKLMNRDEY